MTLTERIRSIGYACACFFIAMTATEYGAAAEQKVFRCETGGKVTYSDVACAGKPEAVEIDARLNTFSADESPQLRSKESPKQVVKRRSASIAEEQARHKEKCKDLAGRIDAITAKLWSDDSLRSRSNQTEKLRAQQVKLEAERRSSKCH